MPFYEVHLHKTDDLVGRMVIKADTQQEARSVALEAAEKDHDDVIDYSVWEDEWIQLGEISEPDEPDFNFGAAYWDSSLNKWTTTKPYIFANEEGKPTGNPKRLGRSVDWAPYEESGDWALPSGPSHRAEDKEWTPPKIHLNVNDDVDPYDLQECPWCGADMEHEGDHEGWYAHCGTCEGAIELRTITENIVVDIDPPTEKWTTDLADFSADVITQHSPYPIVYGGFGWHGTTSFCWKCGDSHHYSKCKSPKYDDALARKKAMLKQVNAAIKLIGSYKDSDWSRESKNQDIKDLRELRRMIKNNHFGIAKHYFNSLDTNVRDHIGYDSKISFEAEAVENEVGCDQCNRFAKLWFYPNFGLKLCATCSKWGGFRAESFEAPRTSIAGVADSRVCSECNIYGYWDDNPLCPMCRMKKNAESSDSEETPAQMVERFRGLIRKTMTDMIGVIDELSDPVVLSKSVVKDLIDRSFELGYNSGNVDGKWEMKQEMMKSWGAEDWKLETPIVDRAMRLHMMIERATHHAMMVAMEQQALLAMLTQEGHWLEQGAEEIDLDWIPEEFGMIEPGELIEEIDDMEDHLGDLENQYDYALEEDNEDLEYILEEKIIEVKEDIEYLIHLLYEVEAHQFYYEKDEELI